MPYAIMRFKKTGTGGIAPAQKHNEREKTKYKSNPDIDAKRIKDDYHIIKPDRPYCKRSAHSFAQCFNAP